MHLCFENMLDTRGGCKSKGITTGKKSRQALNASKKELSLFNMINCGIVKIGGIEKKY